MRLLTRLYKFIPFLVVWFSFPLYAYDNFNVGTRYLALGGCGATLTDIWSMSHNQAGIAYLKDADFSVFHEQRFMVKEMSNTAWALFIPSKYLNTGLSTNYFGYSKYYQIKAGVTFARTFGTNFAAGMRFNFFSTFNHPNNNHLNKYNLDLGIISYVTENLALGFYATNIIPDKQNNLQDPSVNTSASIGMSYDFEQKLKCLIEIKIGILQKPTYMAGIEYNVVKPLALRLGISDQADFAGYSFGFGYMYRKLRLSMAFVNNQILGMSPSIEIGYRF